MTGRYDLTDEQYALIEPLLPPERAGRPGRPYRPHRHVLNGIVWSLRTGAPWRDLPERYGPWKTVYDRFRRWRNAGLWQQVLDALLATGRKLDRFDFDFGALDSTVVRAHKSAAGAKKGAAPPIPFGAAIAAARAGKDE
ncbi:MAG: IS5 family transposase, partial [Candidatus Brocadiia bacterium]